NRLEITLEIFSPSDPGRIGPGWQPALGRLWIDGLARFVDYAYREVSDARAAGREVVLPAADLMALKAMSTRPGYLATILAPFGPDIRASLTANIAVVLAAAPTSGQPQPPPEAAGTTQVDGVRSAIDAADRTQNPAEADALRRTAAHLAASDPSDPSGGQ